MSSNDNPNSIQIIVNGQKKNVYANQSVLQALLQINENIHHCCHEGRNNQINNMKYDCAIKIKNYNRKRSFKACLAQVEADMELTTEWLSSRL
jgi:NADH dehydrogenase/NADH:ubiquinone oxidoreductase subunit G